MALPAVTKVWDFSGINQRLKRQATGATTLNTFRQLLWKIKSTLVGWGWTVRGSCNTAGVYGMDGVDRWITSADLNWSSWSSPSGWIVLTKANAAGAGKNLDLMIWLDSPFGHTAGQVWVSYSAFTGGTTSARPTAAGEKQVLGTGSYAPWTNISISATITDFNCWFHAIQSTDNEVQRIFATYNGTILFNLSLEKAQNPVSAWTHPFVCAWTTEITYAAYNDVAAFWAYDANATAGWMSLYAATAGAKSLAHGETGMATMSNSIDGAHFFGDIGLVSETTGKKGRHGQLYDWWFLPTAVLTGDSYPSTGAPQFIAAGQCAFPWDSINPLRTV